ncbi:MAG: septal ring lytic transglycosylase RlpA family protein, partial [Thermoanaerobaculia bacterium]
MRYRLPKFVVAVFLFYGCVTTKPHVPAPSDVMEGVASWYGQEFAGRTTANGEIFDPLLLTAAHRTLPFGTVLDVVNPATSQTVRVRVNDRGPYVGNRVIDLSYAAARQIGLVEPGIGEVKITIVKLGRGEREPPAPFVVALDPPAKTEEPAKVGDPPSVAFPLPGQVKTPPTGDVVVDRVEVREQRGGTVT